MRGRDRPDDYRGGLKNLDNGISGHSATSLDVTGLLKQHDIAISMDGKGAWRDNVFVERLWRSVKYEEVYLRASDSVAEARISPGCYFDFYNRVYPHSCSITPIGLCPPCVPLQEWQTQRQAADIPLILGGNLFRQSRPPQSNGA